MPNRYLPLRYMSAVEQRDEKFTHKLETEYPEYVEIADLVYYEKILVLLPFADETHIRRWETSLGILPSSQDIEERRNYLMILISQKIKPSIKTLEEMSYKLTGLHAQISMVVPKRLKYGAYISDNPTASSDDKDYYWFNGDTIKNIGTLRINFESDGSIKNVEDYFNETIYPKRLYKVYNADVAEGFVWMMGNIVLDTVEEATVQGQRMYKVTYDNKVDYVSRIQHKYANIAFADERTSTLLPNTDFGDGLISGNTYKVLEAEGNVAHINFSNLVYKDTMFVDTYFDAKINEEDIFVDVYRGLRGIRELQGKDGDRAIYYDGRYIQVAYADNESGDGFSFSDDTKAYIGLRVDANPTDSTNPALYDWTEIDTHDRTQGYSMQGEYLHLSWSDNPESLLNENIIDGSGRLYVGLYVNTNQDETVNGRLYEWHKMNEEPKYFPRILSHYEPIEPYKTEMQAMGYWRYYYRIPRIDVNRWYDIEIDEFVEDIEFKDVSVIAIEGMSYTYTDQKYIGLFIDEGEYTNKDHTKFHWQEMPKNGTITDGKEFVHVAWRVEEEALLYQLHKPYQAVKRNIIYVHFLGQLPQISFNRYASYLRTVIPAHLDLIITFGEPIETSLYPYVYSGTQVSVTVFD